MREFFRGWKRKVGCFTLLMALVFVAGWVRSLSKIDRLFYLVDAQNLHVMVSCPKGIGWVRFRALKASQIIIAPVGMLWSDSQNWGGYGSNLTYSLPLECDTAWCQRFGLQMGTQFDGTPTTLQEKRFLGISYWSVTISLTLISAFLLLSKPRKSNQTKPIEPISFEGA